MLEPVCCKKQQKKFLTSYWFVEEGTSEDSDWYKFDPGWSGESLRLIYYQFEIIHVLQRSPILQTSNWPVTFFAVSHSKPALHSYLFCKSSSLQLQALPYPKGKKNGHQSNPCLHVLIKKICTYLCTLPGKPVCVAIHRGSSYTPARWRSTALFASTLQSLFLYWDVSVSVVTLWTWYLRKKRGIGL